MFLYFSENNSTWKHKLEIDFLHRYKVNDAYVSHMCEYAIIPNKKMQEKETDDKEMESLYFWVGGNQSLDAFVRVIIQYKRNTS